MPIILFLAVFVFTPFQGAQAEGLVPCGGEDENPCEPCHLLELGSNVITFLLVPSTFNNWFAIVPLLAGLLLALGGFFFLISGTNLARLEQGKQIIKATVVGLIIIYTAWLFLSLLLSALDMNDWTGLDTWWQIECEFAPPGVLVSELKATLPEVIPGGGDTYGVTLWLRGEEVGSLERFLRGDDSATPEPVGTVSVGTFTPPIKADQATLWARDIEFASGSTILELFDTSGTLLVSQSYGSMGNDVLQETLLDLIDEP